MKLVSFKICPYVQRIAAMLEAKDMAYDVEYISLDNSPDWFTEISPHAQVPVLITDNGEALFESEAIAEYLDEIAPPLEPELSPEQRAKDLAWGYMASNLYIPQCSAMRSEDEATLKDRREELDKILAKVEQQIDQGPYYKVESISNLDIAWLPVLHRAAIIEKYGSYDFLAEYPKLKSLQRHLMESGLAEKSVPGDFEDVFTRFYLSQSSYLGREARLNYPESEVRMCG